LLCRAEQFWINEAQITSGVLKFIDAVRNQMSDYTTGLFQNGGYTSPDGQHFPITDVLQGGLWLANTFKQIDSVDITADWRKVLYGKMLQVAWRTNTKRRPVILGPYNSLDDNSVYTLAMKKEKLSEVS
jgi:hypothetical protein